MSYYDVVGHIAIILYRVKYNIIPCEIIWLHIFYFREDCNFFRTQQFFSELATASKHDENVRECCNAQWYWCSVSAQGGCTDLTRDVLNKYLFSRRPWAERTGPSTWTADLKYSVQIKTNCDLCFDSRSAYRPGFPFSSDDKEAVSPQPGLLEQAWHHSLWWNRLQWLEPADSVSSRSRWWKQYRQWIGILTEPG